MHLYIIRHGIASEPSDWPGPDATRPLLPEGFTRTHEVFKQLRKRGELDAEAIWSSPYTRAWQTAQIAGEVLGLVPLPLAALQCGSSLQTLLHDFKARQPLPERLMLVGHEPDCGLIIAELIGDPGGAYPMKKAGVALLKGDFSPGGMALKWKRAPGDVLNG